MGNETDMADARSLGITDCEVKVTRIGAPGRAESEIYYRGKRILFVGIQEALYVAFWNSGIAGTRFFATMIRLGVPRTTETLLDAQRLKDHLYGTLGELEDQLSVHPRPTFIRVDTDHLDFTWQSGQGRPRRPSITGIIGDQVDMAVLKRYFTLTTRKSLPTPVTRVI